MKSDRWFTRWGSAGDDLQRRVLRKTGGLAAVVREAVAVTTGATTAPV